MNRRNKSNEYKAKLNTKRENSEKKHKDVNQDFQTRLKVGE